MIEAIYFPFRHYITVPSSRGLGRWPLTPETGVRFPLGPPINFHLSILIYVNIMAVAHLPVRPSLL